MVAADSAAGDDDGLGAEFELADRVSRRCDATGGGGRFEYRTPYTDRGAVHLQRTANEEAVALGEALTQELSRRGFFEVISAGDIRALLGVERQRALLGCSDSSCTAELSGALGARFVLQGKTVVTVELPVWKHYACGVAPQSKAEYRRQARRAGAPV